MKVARECINRLDSCDWILGLGGSTHDYSACLLRNGRIEIAIEEERVSRKKRGYGVDPARAQCIDYCLEACSIGLEDVRVVAINDLLEPAMYERLDLPTLTMGHHLTHAASSVFASPFDEAAVLVMDHGGGRYSDGDCLVAETISYYHARGSSIDLVGRISGMDELGSPPAVPSDLRGSRGIAALKRPRNSIGRLYARVSKLCGCVTRMGDGALHSESGKLMGLSAYGGDRYVETFRRMIELRDHGRVHITLGGPEDGLEGLCRRALAEAAAHGEEILFECRADLARAAQTVLEDVVLHAARHLRDMTGSGNLCLAGGVALNGLANHRILEETGFRSIFVQPAAHDAGTALGAAYMAAVTMGDAEQYMNLRNENRRFNPFLGRTYGDGEIRDALERSGIPFVRCRDTAMSIARALEAGKIVAMFQGRSEIGPRALGNRSILADCRDARTKEHLDRRVKLREPYRPYAPAVRAEEASRFFDLRAESPYMLLVGRVRPEWADRLPAVRHVDGTARVQTVRYEDNTRLHDVLRAFGERTGLGVVLNTSMNVMGEPIVESPDDAIRFFNTTQVDVMFVEDFACSRDPAHLQESTEGTAGSIPSLPSRKGRLRALLDRVHQAYKRRSALRRETFTLAQCGFDCEADDEDQIAAVRQFFAWEQSQPPSAVEQERIRHRLVSLHEPSLTCAIAAELATLEPDEVVETFEGQCFHARYASDGGENIFIETGVAPERNYCVVQQPGCALVLRGSRSPSLFTYLVRCLREVYLREMENRGGISMHAAAFVREEGATLIVGGKGAGKTSLVLASSISPGYAYLGNDRVMLMPHAEGADAHSFPLTCRVGLGTISALPPLGELFLRHERLSRRQQEAVLANSSDALQFASNAKLEITPLELITLLGVKHAESARVRRILFPQIGDGAEPSMERVAKEEALRKLQREAYTPREEKWINPWLVNRTRSDDALRNGVEHALRELLDVVPAFLLRYGFDYFVDGKLNPVLARLLEEAS